MKTIFSYVEEQKRNITRECRANEIDEKRSPLLLIIQVGNLEESNIDIKNKIHDCDEVGIQTKRMSFPEIITTDQLVAYIKYMNDVVDGLSVQLPLPEHLDKEKIINAIDDHVDVDGLKSTSTFRPCTSDGIVSYLKWAKFQLDGKNAVVIGRSELVGKPLASMLINENMNVTLLHSHTSIVDKIVYTQHADYIFVATHHPNLLTKEMVRPNHVIFDIGINYIDNKIMGDCDYKNIMNKCKLITEVPAKKGGFGSVGLLNRIALLNHIMESYNTRLK